MRWFFILVPALIVTGIVFILLKYLALFFFVGMIGLGYQVTKSRPERGEGE